MPKQQQPNPMWGKNIPPPPAPPQVVQSPVSRDNGIFPDSTSEEKENATIELSLYLRPSQDDKLDDLRRAYKKRTGKKISANEVMRRLIDQATLDMLLE